MSFILELPLTIHDNALKYELFSRD